MRRPVSILKKQNGFWSNDNLSKITINLISLSFCRRTYVNGKVEGQATVIFQDGSKEMRNYQNNKPTGQAILFATNGDRIEFNYENGVINGKAAIKGSNGDKENCVYVKGVKHGPATYLWKAGHR